MQESAAAYLLESWMSLWENFRKLKIFDSPASLLLSVLSLAALCTRLLRGRKKGDYLSEKWQYWSWRVSCLAWTRSIGKLNYEKYWSWIRWSLFKNTKRENKKLQLVFVCYNILFLFVVSVIEIMLSSCWFIFCC